MPRVHTLREGVARAYSPVLEGQQVSIGTTQLAPENTSDVPRRIPHYTINVCARRKIGRAVLRRGGNKWRWVREVAVPTRVLRVELRARGQRHAMASAGGHMVVFLAEAIRAAELVRPGQEKCSFIPTPHPLWHPVQTNSSVLNRCVHAPTIFRGRGTGRRPSIFFCCKENGSSNYTLTNSQPPLTSPNSKLPSWWTMRTWTG